MDSYRDTARQRLAKANQLLATGQVDDLTYACLELRKVIEALSYDLLNAYLKEVALGALETWQPDKVIKELLRIDPRADQSVRIRMKREGRDGEPDGPWKSLGEDRRLNAKTAAKAYHQLGNFLHVPTIKQVRSNKPPDMALVRTRAERVRDEIAHVLNARIWGVNFADRITFNCTECEAPIARRTSVLKVGEDIECGNCGQPFSVELEPDGRYLFVPLSFSWVCAACDKKCEIPQGRAKDGLDVSCKNCGDHVTLALERQWRLVRLASKEAGDGNTRPAELE